MVKMVKNPTQADLFHIAGSQNTLGAYAGMLLWTSRFKEKMLGLISYIQSYMKELLADSVLSFNKNRRFVERNVGAILNVTMECLSPCVSTEWHCKHRYDPAIQLHVSTDMFNI